MNGDNKSKTNKYIYLSMNTNKKKLKMRVEKKGERLLYNILTNH